MYKTGVNVQEIIAERAAKELKPTDVVNLGIGIPTLVAKYMEKDSIYFHTENGLLGVGEVADEDIDPNLVNAGKLPVAEEVGASFFDSAASFAMIRGGHVDIAILGALQVDETGQLANWAIPGKTILGVGGAMDLLVGAKKIIVTMTHTTKEGKSKLLKSCSFPITSTRRADVIITELAVFEVKDGQLQLRELMPGATIDKVMENTAATFRDVRESI